MGEYNDLEFTYRVAKNGSVLISHHGKMATTLRGKKAADFVKKMETAEFSKQQQTMARLTGNYKRGNERQAKRHPRNR